MNKTNDFQLYPEIEPFKHGLLQVDAIHHIYFEVCGNPKGPAVVFLHGGPGSGCNPSQRRFFDPSFYCIVLLDQRGCGRSKPQGAIDNNTTDLLVQDIELVRQHLEIERWHVFGGSWGSTLALCYALAHASRVLSLTLRGIFLSRSTEIDWFLGQVRLFYPDAWQRLIEYLPKAKQNDVLNAYTSLVFSDDTTISFPAAIRWNAFESSIMTLLPKEDNGVVIEHVELARARVQIHYIQHLCFVGHRDLLEEARLKLQNIPTVIVQGRYDMVCPPETAWELSQVLPHAEFVMVPDAGHSAMEHGTCQALLAATEKFKSVA